MAPSPGPTHPADRSPRCRGSSTVAPDGWQGQQDPGPPPGLWTVARRCKGAGPSGRWLLRPRVVDDPGAMGGRVMVVPGWTEWSGGLLPTRAVRWLGRWVARCRAPHCRLPEPSAEQPQEDSAAAEPTETRDVEAPSPEVGQKRPGRKRRRTQALTARFRRMRAWRAAAQETKALEDVLAEHRVELAHVERQRFLQARSCKRAQAARQRRRGAEGVEDAASHSSAISSQPAHSERAASSSGEQGAPQMAADSVSYRATIPPNSRQSPKTTDDISYNLATSWPAPAPLFIVRAAAESCSCGRWWRIRPSTVSQSPHARVCLTRTRWANAAGQAAHM